MSEDKKATPQLEPARFHLTEHEQLFYTVTIEQGVTKEQVLDPAFFAHVASKLKPYTEITVRCDDGSLYGKLLVLGADRAWARVRVLEWYDLTSKDVAISQAQSKETAEALVDPSEQYRIEHKGPHIKWRVVRIADAKVMREREETKMSAMNWLTEFLKVTS